MTRSKDAEAHVIEATRKRTARAEKGTEGENKRRRIQHADERKELEQLRELAAQGHGMTVGDDVPHAGGGAPSNLAPPAPPTQARKLSTTEKLVAGSWVWLSAVWVLFIMRHLASPELCHAMTGHTGAELMELFGLLGPVLQGLTVRGSDRMYDHSGELMITDFSYMFMTLYWLKTYPTYEGMESCFGIFYRNFGRIILRGLTALKRVVRDDVSWPTEEEFARYSREFKGFAHSRYRDVLCIVDGTGVHVPRPLHDQQSLVYNPHHHRHEVNILLVTLLNGQIIFVSTQHRWLPDQAHWNATGLRAKFEGKPYGIAGDGGFWFNRQRDKSKIIGYRPHKRDRSGPSTHHLTEYERRDNTALSQIRVVVENTIRQVKTWGVISGKFRHFSLSQPHDISIEDVVDVVAGLTNRRLRVHPLRIGKWRSKAAK